MHTSVESIGRLLKEHPLRTSSFTRLRERHSRFKAPNQKIPRVDHDLTYLFREYTWKMEVVGS
jgi:hypothetical protein